MHTKTPNNFLYRPDQAIQPDLERGRFIGHASSVTFPQWNLQHYPVQFFPSGWWLLPVEAMLSQERKKKARKKASERGEERCNQDGIAM